MHAFSSLLGSSFFKTLQGELPKFTREPFRCTHEGLFGALSQICLSSLFWVQVASIEDCGSVKDEHSEKDPNRYKWYHEDQGLCCKLDWTSVFTFVGWSYKRQDTMDLCLSEVRPVPSTSCCHLKDKIGSVGLRVKKATAEAFVSTNIYYDSEKGRRFFKVLEFDMEDISESTDYTGQAVQAADAQGFVRNAQKAGMFKELQCSEVELVKDAGQCVLRTEASMECCCHQARADATSRKPY